VLKRLEFCRYIHFFFRGFPKICVQQSITITVKIKMLFDKSRYKAKSHLSRFSGVQTIARISHYFIRLLDV
jgi:hypothetical protein